MRFKLENIESSRVNVGNRDFRISTDRAPGGLRDSIDRLGILNPPALFPEDDRFIVVSGFRRIEAALDLGWKEISCRLLPADASPRFCVRIAIADNSMQRPLDVIETSRALALLKSRFDETELTEEASRLGLPSNRGRIDELEPLCKLPPRVVDGILRESIAVPVALELSKMSEKEANSFAELFLASNCSLNKQREIVRMVEEIARRDDETVIGVLSESTLRGIVRNPDMDKNRKAREIRARLRKIRYPNIVEAEKKFAETVERLGLDSGMKLIPPKDFEGSVYGFLLGFKNAEELKKRGEKLLEVVNGPEIKSLFA